jgi:S-adenosylmethionine synthetase
MEYTAECVNKYHPDKICDQIADLIVDECLKNDINSRVAVEVLGGHGEIVLKGEITTKSRVNYKKLARDYYFILTGKRIKVKSKIVHQSPDIAVGVDQGGAGDQGIVVGYACNENNYKIPMEMYLARKIIEPFIADGKSQVTIKNGKITNIVLSVQGYSKKQLNDYLFSFLKVHNIDCRGISFYCNNTGKFDIGGFDADCGVTGRKIVVDAYGPRVSVGGGAFSGKDPTKIDRSGAYMARWIAVQLLHKYKAHEVVVKIAYVIGKQDPVMQIAYIDGKEKQLTYDCRPQSIIRKFNLLSPIYLSLARNGHFGLINPWDKL